MSMFSAAVVLEIQAEMARQFMTQSDLARRIDRNPMWVNRRVSYPPVVDMTLRELAVIADALGTSPAAFVLVAAESNEPI